MSTGGTANNMTCRRPRAVAGLLVALWLSLGLGPCAIAADISHACPHCPTEPADAEHGHHARHTESPAESHSTSQPEDSDCASMQADCCDALDASVDGRTGKLDTEKPGDNPVAVAPHGPPVHAASLWRAPVAITGPPLLLTARTPLNVFHCVYLK